MMTGSPLAVLVDFDDTAAEQNLAEAVLETFADTEWKVFRTRFRAGSVTLREYQESAFNLVRAHRDEMARAVPALVSLRPGLEELRIYCETNGFQLAIVTNGLDFYVRAALQSTTLRATPIYAVGVSGSPGALSYSYPYATETCWEWGNCKCRVLEGFRGAGARIVYVGDGLSDLCASRQADFVFARSTLLEHCREHDLPHQAFTDFRDVVATLERRVGADWPPSRSRERVVDPSPMHVVSGHAILMEPPADPRIEGESAP